MLTQKKVRKLFHYNADTGVITWKVNTSSRVMAGKAAGCISNHGYLRVSIGGKRYLNHRIIWLLHFGYLPEGQIDHINRNRIDNRICNMREVSALCNTRNSGIGINNTSGVVGVHWRKDISKWEAKVTVNYRGKSLGVFSVLSEAVAHRLAAEQCLQWSLCSSDSSAYKFIFKEM